MTVRYNRKRVFRVWELNGRWYAADMKDIVNGQLRISYNQCISGGSKDEVIDQIEVRCKFDEMVENGMDRLEAARMAMFDE